MTRSCTFRLYVPNKELIDIIITLIHLLKTVHHKVFMIFEYHIIKIYSWITINHFHLGIRNLITFQVFMLNLSWIPWISNVLLIWSITQNVGLKVFWTSSLHLLILFGANIVCVYALRSNHKWIIVNTLKTGNISPTQNFVSCVSCAS